MPSAFTYTPMSRLFAVAVLIITGGTVGRVALLLRAFQCTYSAIKPRMRIDPIAIRPHRRRRPGGGIPGRMPAFLPAVPFGERDISACSPSPLELVIV